MDKKPSRPATMTGGTREAQGKLVEKRKAANPTRPRKETVAPDLLRTLMSATRSTEIHLLAETKEAVKLALTGLSEVRGWIDRDRVALEPVFRDGRQLVDGHVLGFGPQLKVFMAILKPRSRDELLLRLTRAELHLKAFELANVRGSEAEAAFWAEYGA